MSSKRIGLRAVSFFFAVVLGCSAAFAAGLPTYGRVAPFELVNRDGRKISASTLRGKIWIADFIYTRCTDTCPLLTHKMFALSHKLSSPVQIVSFTVDPSHDTPAVLDAYAKRFGVAPGRWYFLTGGEKALAQVFRKSFMLAVAKQKDGTVAHTTKFALIDAAGNIRGYYDGDSDASLAKLARDAAGLAKRG